jgi:molecular chaperone DnaK
LSERRSVRATIDHEDKRLELEILRDQFEQLIADIIERTELTVSIVLRDAGLTWPQVDRLLLVGGSTRIPMVATMLEGISGKRPDRSLSPDEAVGLGAALYAGMVWQDKPRVQTPGFVDVCAHSLGVVGRDPASGRRAVTVVIPKNTPIPCTAEKIFHTGKDDQRAVVVPVVEGESHKPQECIQIGKCEIRDLPSGLAGGTRVAVGFRYSSEGLLTITARVPKVRRSANVEVFRDHTGHVEDLPTWRMRLTGKISDSRTDGDESLAAMSTGTALEHIQRLYADIGRAALAVDLPWRLHGAQKRAHTEMARLSQLETNVERARTEHEAAVTHTERLQSLSELSRWPCTYGCSSLVCV